MGHKNLLVLQKIYKLFSVKKSDHITRWSYRQGGSTVVFVTLHQQANIVQPNAKSRMPLRYHHQQYITIQQNNKYTDDTSGESRGPIHCCNDCNTKECSSLAAEDKDEGVVGFLSFCPNWLPLSFPAPAKHPNICYTVAQHCNNTRN